MIQAKFDPYVDKSQNTPTDASKLTGGNRHGTHSEQRVTLDLADDYYTIASDAKYNYSKMETGKNLQHIKMLRCGIISLMKFILLSMEKTS